ncbi:phage portal protein [Escherichia coli]
MNFSSELLNKGNKTPAFSISIEGRDITTVLDNRLIGLTLTDNRGFEADQLDLELDDADGKIVLPRRGAVITLALGWKGQPLFPKGAFTVDEIEHTGAPDRLTIRARSADFRETLNTRREKSWHNTTIGEVVKEIAARHKLKMALGKELSDKPVEHIDQTNESDGSFLMRLARQYGAIASVKNGNLLFIRQGQGKSATGKPLPVITITRKDGDSHRFTLADRGAYTGVIASWLHTREPAKKESTTVKRKRRTKKQKKEPEPDINQEIYGLPGYLSAIPSALLNESATLFRRKYYINGSHAGFIMYMTDAAQNQEDVNNLRNAMKSAKGPGNFRNLFMYSPNGKKDGLQIIPLSEVAAKDEFLNIKNVSRDDMMAAHRVPPQMMGIMPNNVGGFGDVEKASRVFVRNELMPLQKRLQEMNDWLGKEAIQFNTYSLDIVP